MNPIKKFYMDMRLGSGVATPIFSYSSFVLIAYNFTGLKEIPFPVFVAGFTAALITGFIIIGSIFRNHQMSTDQDLIYYQQKELIRTQRITLEAITKHPDIETTQQVTERIEYLKRLEAGK